MEVYSGKVNQYLIVTFISTNLSHNDIQPQVNPSKWLFVELPTCSPNLANVLQVGYENSDTPSFDRATAVSPRRFQL